MKRLLLSILLLLPSVLAAQTPLEDLRNWRSEALVAGAVWHTKGHPPSWQQQRIEQDGYRLRLTFRFPQNMPDPKGLYLPQVEADSATYQFASDNRLPITLRIGNLDGTFQYTHRMELIDGKIPDASPLVWNENSGVIDDSPLVDMFGDPAIWENGGRVWAGRDFAVRVRELMPNPVEWDVLDNNEGPEDDLWRYTKVIPGTHANGLVNREWLPDDTLRKLSLRFMAHGLSGDPYAVVPEYNAMVTAQRQKLFAAFSAGMTDWPAGGLVGYGAGVERKYPPDPTYGPIGATWFYTANSPSYYVANDVPADMRSVQHWTNLQGKKPAWLKREELYPSKAYRDLSIGIKGSGAVWGAKQGLHPVVTPERYEYYTAWTFWSMREPGVPSILRFYQADATKPDQPFFDTDQRGILDTLGYPEAVKALTVYDYERPVFRVVNDACTDFREFLKGQPLAWEPSVGATTVETFVAGSVLTGKALIVGWSPTDSTNVTTIDVPGIGPAEIQGSGVWIVTPPAGKATATKVR